MEERRQTTLLDIHSGRSTKSSMPLLFVTAHTILSAPGSAVSCGRLNSSALRILTLLRNRLKDSNKESLALTMRCMRPWINDNSNHNQADVDFNDSSFTNDDAHAERDRTDESAEENPSSI